MAVPCVPVCDGFDPGDTNAQRQLRRNGLAPALVPERMDVLKLFTDDRLGLESLSADTDADARRRDLPLDSLDAFLAEARAAPYARVYLAGSRLGEAAPDGSRPALRTGLTALAHPEAFVAPLLAWADGRPWHALRGDALVGLTAPEAAAALGHPDSDTVLTVGTPAPGIGAEMGRLSGERRETLAPLRRALDAGLAVLLPEPAPDGSDWSLYARAPLAEPLLDAVRATPPPPDTLRFAAPYQTMRGEHRFYFERWALDALPPSVVEL